MVYKSMPGCSKQHLVYLDTQCMRKANTKSFPKDLAKAQRDLHGETMGLDQMTSQGPFQPQQFCETESILPSLLQLLLKKKL